MYLSKDNDKAKENLWVVDLQSKRRKAAGYKSFKEICCLNDENGKPYIKDEPCHVSISHENHYAVAFVVIENNDPNQ
ncbi:MAG: hypothetical protein ACLS85_02075 [Coprobacillus cateniformis]